MTNFRNETHDYELSLLQWIVVEPINGGTNWNTLAAFRYMAEAVDYCARINDEGSERDLPYEVRNVGSAYRQADGTLVEAI